MMAWEIREPEQLKELDNICGVKLKDLTEWELKFYNYLKSAGYKYVVPECVRRVLELSAHEGDLNDYDREHQWKKNVTYSTLKTRKNTTTDTYPDKAGTKGYDRFGRKNIPCVDGKGFTHIDPVLIIYCHVGNLDNSKAKKEKVVAF